MKQLLQNMRTGETEIMDVPIPTPRPGMVLVRTAASLVSAGTERMVVSFAEKSLVGKARSRPDLVRQLLDKMRREGPLTALESAFSRLDQPMVLGYSSSGVIVALGEGVTGWQVGQRVACAGGGYAVHAEYAVVPVNLLASLPDEVDFESAAFATLGAISMHGFRLAETQLGERVGIIGLGLLGLLAAGLAQAAGCHVFGVDLDPNRVALARSLGCTAVLRSESEEAALAFSRGRGLDAILICADTSSNDPVTLAGDIARDRARVVAVGAVGLEIPRKAYFAKEITFLNSRSYGPGRYDPVYEEGGVDYPFGYVRWTEGRNLEAFVDLLAAKRLDVQPLVSHRFSVEEATEAYQLITGKVKQPFLGILLSYPQALEPLPDLKPTPPPAAQPGIIPREQQTACKVGLLGAGNFASAVLLPTLKQIPQVSLVGVASASGVTARHAANKYGFKFAASQDMEVIAHPDVNTLAVLTRHNLHASQVLAGLQAGKNVFCEKPLAIQDDELAALLPYLEDEASGPLITVGFNRRFAPLALKMRAFFASRQEPLMMSYRVNAGYLPLTHWLHDPDQGGGRVIGEGCHFIDFLTYLVGAPPVNVAGHSLPDAGKYRQDNVQLTFTFPDGSVGTVFYLANGDKSFSKERVEVFCSGRVAVLEDFRRLEMVQDGRRSVAQTRLRQDKGHKAIWQAFAQAVTTAGPPPIPYSHLIGVTRASFAAVQALSSGPQVINAG